MSRTGKTSVCATPWCGQLPELYPGAQSQSWRPTGGITPHKGCCPSSVELGACVFTVPAILPSSNPSAEAGQLPEGGLPRDQPHCRGKEGRGAAGAKRNINLTFSKGVNPFTVLQQ